MNFIHLNVKSNYSLLSSLVSIDDLIHECKQQKIHSIALTDQSVMYGSYYFYKKCKENNIKPILGLELELPIQSTSLKIILLAKNKEGYQNLLQLSSISSFENISVDLLRKHANSLLCIIPSRSSFFEVSLRNDDVNTITMNIKDLKEIFNDFYIGIEDLDVISVVEMNKKVIQLSQTMDVELVLLNEVLYLKKEDAKYIDYIYAIRDGKKIDDPNRNQNITDQNYLKSIHDFSHIPSSWIKNTEIIASKCNVDLQANPHQLPHFKLQQDVSNTEYLSELCRRGLMKRYGQDLTNEHINRLNYELDIIIKMGFTDYFLIVWDFIKYAKTNGILVGPGRGSAAGSLVSYCLGITNIDPIKYNLLFERFLNPERISMPDIDIDFPDHRRDEVIQYVANKYGKEYVAQIITFGSMGAKQALRDVGRVMDIPLGIIDRLSKTIPNTLNITLSDAYDTSELFRKMVNETNQMKQLFDVARVLEGMPRHTSTHAAGIVMSNEPLTSILPIQKGNDYLNITQYSMEYLEELGLLKMDFLGLRNLTILTNIIEQIETKLRKKIDLNQISYQDPDTLRLFQTGNTTGVFQFESDGMRNVLRQLMPTSLEDIIATNALFRPGPMDNIQSFIHRKHGLEQINYIHPDLEEILKPTYGIIVYQEQIMQIALKMATYTLGEADILRRAVSKKIKEVLDQERERFVINSQRNGYDLKTANEVYDLIVKFANYGFNRAHSVAYSVLGYQMAYLKAHYPMYFMSALLSSVIGSETKTREYISECKSLRIKVLAPSINQSGKYFQAEGTDIRFALSSIKNVGEAAITTILLEQAKTPFKDFTDFFVRVYSQSVNKRVIESLIDANVFSEFLENNATMHYNIDALISYCDVVRPIGEYQLFENNDLMNAFLYHEVQEFGEEELLEREKKALGFNLNHHPVLNIKENLKANHEVLYDVIEYNNLIGEKIKSVVYIQKIRETKTKKGELMAFVTASDETGETDFVLFPSIYEKIGFSAKNKVVLVYGKVEKRLQNIQMVIDSIKTL